MTEMALHSMPLNWCIYINGEAVIPGQKAPPEERAYFDLRFQKARVHHGGKGMATGAWGWLGNQEVRRSHFIHTQEADRQEVKRPGYKTSEPIHSAILPSGRLHLLRVP